MRALVCRSQFLSPLPCIGLNYSIVGSAIFGLHCKITIDDILSILKALIRLQSRLEKSHSSVT